MTKIKLVLSAVLVLGATSGALAEITENKVGDIYPAPAQSMQRPANGMPFQPAQASAKTKLAAEKMLFDRQTWSVW